MITNSELMNIDLWRLFSTFCLFFPVGQRERERWKGVTLVFSIRFLHSFPLKWKWGGDQKKKKKKPRECDVGNDEKKEAYQAGISRNHPRNNSLLGRKSKRANCLRVEIWILCLSLPQCPWAGPSTSLGSSLLFLISGGWVNSLVSSEVLWVQTLSHQLTDPG